MDIMYERCCGLDVHKQTVVACVLEPGSGRQPHKEIRTFGTVTDDLLELLDWLVIATSKTSVRTTSTSMIENAPSGDSFAAWRNTDTASPEPQ